METLQSQASIGYKPGTDNQFGLQSINVTLHLNQWKEAIVRENRCGVLEILAKTSYMDDTPICSLYVVLPSFRRLQVCHIFFILIVLGPLYLPSAHPIRLPLIPSKKTHKTWILNCDEFGSIVSFLHERIIFRKIIFVIIPSFEG